MKFEKDFDFESANAQFNKEEIDREFQSKLKLKGLSNILKHPNVRGKSLAMFSEMFHGKS